MHKVKKSNIYTCIINEQFKNFKVGEIITFKKGYAKYLESYNRIYIVTEKCNIKSVLEKKILSKIKEEIIKLKEINKFTIERKTKKSRTTELFTKISSEQVISSICKYHNIKYFESLNLVIEQENQYIDKCGTYNCIIKVNEEEISKVRVNILSKDY